MPCWLIWGVTVTSSNFITIELVTTVLVPVFDHGLNGCVRRNRRAARNAGGIRVRRYRADVRVRRRAGQNAARTGGSERGDQPVAELLVPNLETVDVPGLRLAIVIPEEINSVRIAMTVSMPDTRSDPTFTPSMYLSRTGGVAARSAAKAIRCHVLGRI